LLSTNKILFIDGGSNVGQAYSYFSKLLPVQTKFVLFEPNPNCIPFLNKIYAHENVLEINNNALYINNSKTVLSSINDKELCSEGASIIADHNNKYSKINHPIAEIQCIDISKYIDSKSDEYEFIILKLDIECAEYDVLEYLIETKTIKKVCLVIVEWHDQYMSSDTSNSYIQRRKQITNKLTELKITCLDWI